MTDIDKLVQELNKKLKQKEEILLAKIKDPLTKKIIKFSLKNNSTYYRARTLLTKEPETINWIRKFNKGVGRYSNIKSYWRNGLEFKGLDRLDKCAGMSDAVRAESGAISSLSSDFRTFGSTDPKRPWHRESGTGMTKPNGIEIRIFDNFDRNYLQDLLYQ